MSRLIYAILCVLLITWAANGQQYTVESKLPKYTVKNKVKAKHPNCPTTCGCGCADGKSCECDPLRGLTSKELREIDPWHDTWRDGRQSAAGQVTVCQNGVCSVVSSSQPTVVQSSAREGWYLGKNLGRRR